MYSVLIIDDEEPLREAIRILGDWEGLGVTEVLEAADGQAGLQMLEAHKIDLVMVDMKMPEFSGTEFLQRVEEVYPELMTIVISGYNDFEYTRQAIRSKVVDYLLKPVNRQDLNQALRKAVDILEAKRQSESDFITKNMTLNMSIPKLKEKMYLSIIDRSFKKQTNEAFLPLIGADETDNYFGAVVLRILNADQVRRTRFNGDTELLHFAVANVVSELAARDFSCFSFPNPKQEREMIAVYTRPGGFNEDSAFRAELLVKKLAATLSDLFHIRVAAGIGRSSRDILGIADSYEAAKAGLQGLDLLKPGTVLVAGPDGPDEPGSAAREVQPLASRISLIRNALEGGHQNQASGVLGDFLRKLKGGGRFTFSDADRVMQEFILLMNDAALELGAAPGLLPGDSGTGRDFPGLDYEDFESFGDLLHRLLDHYSAVIRRSAPVNKPFDITDIKAYIDDYYYEDIKISVFTEKYYLSREYLMKLFKQEYGFGIHEYVQKVRMDKATELLGNPELKIQEISEMLGYKDKNYFSKAFRNYFGRSPSEYRTAGQR
ncbi:DNA-binding response regulator [Paenibacillus sambharensis]|uniref:DNA-binding response regulator n=1 Tax=Paenibacillus sambharensis TaxID=1803190 RepID=A0A2W1LBI3_9BACL|nr:response regulator [Paenibacillus sambharensis]PZD97598.1 DNA-binding response regulator [Paenibacillus sambharensis]